MGRKEKKWTEIEWVNIMHMIIIFWEIISVSSCDTMIIECYIAKLKKNFSFSGITYFQWLTWKKRMLWQKQVIFSSSLCPTNKLRVTSLYHSQVAFRALQTTQRINGLIFIRLCYWRISKINRRWNEKICSGKTLSLPCILQLYALMHF